MDLWAFGFGLLILFAIGLFVVQISKYHKCKFDIVQPDGFQYCFKCGRATQPLAQPCKHKWDILEQSRVTRHNPNGSERWVGNSYVLKCKHCGDLKEFQENVSTR